MRHPKNPFSPDEPDDDAFDRPRDRHELAADAAPGRGSGTPPPLPRRTGDSGFRPRAGHAPPQQDFWPLTDPEDSWPLAPRPPAEPAGSWSPGDPEDSWAAPAPGPGRLLAPRRTALATTGLRLTRGTTGLSRPGGAVGRSGPAQDGPRDHGAQADPRDDWAQPARRSRGPLLAPRRTALATTGLRLTRGTTGLRPARRRRGRLLAPRRVIPRLRGAGAADRNPARRTPGHTAPRVIRGARPREDLRGEDLRGAGSTRARTRGGTASAAGPRPGRSLRAGVHRPGRSASGR